MGFNPRPRARGDRASRRDTRSRRCFNPRPRARGDVNGQPALFFDGFQSTPPREGRREKRIGLWYDRVSIHAPARGATWREGFGVSSACFNPRPRARGDKPLRDAIVEAKVSIHAPARGATPGNCIHTLFREFQSTPPREGRPWRGMQLRFALRFNPRPRARGDLQDG